MIHVFPFSLYYITTSIRSVRCRLLPIFFNCCPPVNVWIFFPVACCCLPHWLPRILDGKLSRISYCCCMDSRCCCCCGLCCNELVQQTWIHPLDQGCQVAEFVAKIDIFGNFESSFSTRKTFWQQALFLAIFWQFFNSLATK